MGDVSKFSSRSAFIGRSKGKGDFFGRCGAVGNDWSVGIAEGKDVF